MMMRDRSVLACWLCVISLLVISGVVQAEDADWVVDESALFAAPTEAVDGVGLIAEWEPVQALVVSVPLEGVFARRGMGAFMLELICKAAAYTDVVVMHDEEALQAVARVAAAVRDRDETLLERVRFVPARVGTVWLRDYGPVFGVDAERGLVVLDSVYRDARFEARVLQEGETAGRDSATYKKMALDLAKRHKDDTTPVYLAQYLRDRGLGVRVKLVRPPAQVWGGDVATDGMGNLFVSTETLTMHGGRREALERVLRDYYGAEAVIYLEPLPGPVVKHLDMFFKVVNAETFFLASYDAPYEGAGVYGEYLNDEIGRVLERNAARLRAAFPDRAIVRLPMPAVEFKTREQIVREYRDVWYTQKLLSEEPALREHLTKAGTPNEQAHLERRIRERALEQYRKEFNAEPGSENEFKLVDLLIRENSTTTLDEAIQNYAPRLVVYKTFLNSVHVKGAYGEAVLVPRYSADSRTSVEVMKAIESKVQAAYESALPGVEVVWVNCDTVIEMSGALHCVTVTVPAVNN